MAEKFEVAGELDSWCTKCREMLRHTTVAMLDDKPKRVRCNTCNGEHNYRPNVPGSRTKGAKGTRAKAKPRLTKLQKEELARVEQYNLLLSERDLTAARKFSVREVYGVDDIVRHKKFGIGFVTDIVEGDKIRIHFEDGSKLMVHNR